MGRAASTFASIPLFGALNFIDRKVFNEFFYRYYEGFSEDRLLTLAEDMFEDLIKKAIYPRSQDLIDEARREGHPGLVIIGCECREQRRRGTGR